MFVLWLAHLEFLFYDHSHGRQGGFHSIQNTQGTSMVTSYSLSPSKSISRNQEYKTRSFLAKDGSDPCGNNVSSPCFQDLTDTWHSQIKYVCRNLKELVFQGTQIPKSLNIGFIFNKSGNWGKVTSPQSWMEFDYFRYQPCSEKKNKSQEIAGMKWEISIMILLVENGP